MENSNFEKEVLQRLTVIETKLDDWKAISDKAYSADSRSRKNEEEIREIKDNTKWLWRTSLGAVITSVIGIVFILIKIGLGIK